MTVIGHEKLKGLFPEFKEDVKENGIDLRIGKIETISTKEDDFIGAVDDEKILPKTRIVETAELNDTSTDENIICYEIKPRTQYLVTIDRPIHIPHGYIQIYKPRSTLTRCGILLLSSIGDDGFQGYLTMGLYNLNDIPVFLGKNERIIQAVTIMNDGTATEYDGSYQKDKIYRK